MTELLDAHMEKVYLTVKVLHSCASHQTIFPPPPHFLLHCLMLTSESQGFSDCAGGLPLRVDNCIDRGSCILRCLITYPPGSRATACLAPSDSGSQSTEAHYNYYTFPS